MYVLWLTFCVWPCLGRIIATTFTSLDGMVVNGGVAKGVLGSKQLASIRRTADLLYSM
jgi:hypothetical protein